MTSFSRYSLLLRRQNTVKASRKFWYISEQRSARSCLLIRSKEDLSLQQKITNDWIFLILFIIFFFFKVLLFFFFINPRILCSFLNLRFDFPLSLLLLFFFFFSFSFVHYSVMVAIFINVIFQETVYIIW